jgi:hypothetical protein
VCSPIDQAFTFLMRCLRMMPMKPRATHSPCKSMFDGCLIKANYLRKQPSKWPPQYELLTVDATQWTITCLVRTLLVIALGILLIAFLENITSLLVTVIAAINVAHRS